MATFIKIHKGKRSIYVNPDRIVCVGPNSDNSTEIRFENWILSDVDESVDEVFNLIEEARNAG